MSAKDTRPEKDTKGDSLGHAHAPSSQRLGEGHNPAGDEAIHRERVRQAAEKHRSEADDPKEKAEAEHRHSAARDRVLAADYDGQEPAEPGEVEEVLKDAEDRIAEQQDEVARKRKEERHQKR